MVQSKTTRSMLAVIIAAALVVSVGSLAALYSLPVDATKPKHNDDNDNGNSNGDNVVNVIPQQSQLTPLGLGTSPNTGSSVGGDDFASQQLQAQPQQQLQAQPQQQLQAQQAASSSAACGQVVSGVVNLTANLNCSGDGI
ncbi:MAG: hypothetical protein GEU26_17365, partial [Nitrososphaeraceae archaeon]|nr:hypothetical protein [Nitrososphaeraceae archaeon]